MPEDSDTLIQDWSKFVVGSSSKAILYRDFQTLKRQSRKIEFKERYARWEDSILKDLQEAIQKVNGYPQRLIKIY